MGSLKYNVQSQTNLLLTPLRQTKIIFFYRTSTFWDVPLVCLRFTLPECWNCKATASPSWPVLVIFKQPSSCWQPKWSLQWLQLPGWVQLRSSKHWSGPTSLCLSHSHIAAAASDTSGVDSFLHKHLLWLCGWTSCWQDALCFIYVQFVAVCLAAGVDIWLYLGLYRLEYIWGQATISFLINFPLLLAFCWKYFQNILLNFYFTWNINYW